MDTVTVAEVLAFERIWWQHSGGKDQAIRERFGLSPTRYYQQLNQVLNTMEALAADPVTVNRLRRIRVVKPR
ncbi:DUF3263 domain-containing protein [Mycobacteroides abscessus]